MRKVLLVLVLLFYVPLFFCWLLGCCLMNLAFCLPRRMARLLSRWQIELSTDRSG